MKPRELPLGLLVLLVAATGCGRGENAEERQINAMRDEIDSVAAARDRENAPEDTSEAKGAAGSKASPGGLAPATAGKGPTTNVNPGGPPDDEETPAEGANEGPQPTSDDPEDATPRPAIRVNGGGVPTRPPTAPVLPR